MKKILGIIIALCCFVRIYGQTDTIVHKYVEEMDLSNLFLEYTIVYCKNDEVTDDGLLYIKTMEVNFIDSTQFVSAYLESSPFTRTSETFESFTCSFIEFDACGGSLILQGKALDELSYLKAILDIIIQKAPKVYCGDLGTD